MMKPSYSKLMSMTLASMMTWSAMAQTAPPPGFMARTQAQYDALSATDLSFSQYYDLQLRKSTHDAAVAADRARGYDPFEPTKSMCGEGDFENGLNDGQWHGGFGFVLSNGQVDFPNFQGGILGGPINSADAHHTLVDNSSTDPNVGINQVAPTGSNRAVRIGNSIPGNGAELLSKTFVVDASKPLISFWYALVLEDPNHNASDQPSFRVRVIDGNGNEIPGTVNLGNGSDEAIANAANPYFQSTTVNGTTVVYKDWSCAQIDLHQYIGKQVTVQFITKDCSQGGHFGYAYLDDFCGSCASNPWTIHPEESTGCGRGSICFSYTLPTQGSQLGTVDISLDIYQNGVLVGSLSSGMLQGRDRKYCFDFDPLTLPGVDPSLGGFDYTATGHFYLGGYYLGPITEGSAPDGQAAGQNNDYQFNCIQSCCPELTNNLIRNGDFEVGNTDFTSAYTYQPVVAANSVNVGKYSVLTDAQALVVSPTWNTGCPAYNQHLIVNGATGKTVDTMKMAWSQTITLNSGKTYKFCGDFKYLAQCAFSDASQISIDFTGSGSGSGGMVSRIFNQTINSTIGTTPPGCNWNRVTHTFTMPRGMTSMRITVWVNEAVIGDGNDLAMDNFTLVELPAGDTAEAVFNVTVNTMNSTAYNITATPAVPLSGDCKGYWQIEETDINGTPVSLGYTDMSWQLSGTDFPGFNGTSPGTFNPGTYYKITYVRNCSPCNMGSRSSVFVGPRMWPASAETTLASRPAADEDGVQRSNMIEGTGAAMFKAFPNPTAGKLTLTRSGSSKAGGTITLFNVHGQVVKTAPFDPLQTSVEMSIAEFVPGTYMLQMVSSEGAVLYKEKIVKH